MPNPRTFKHTPKEEREAQKRKRRGQRRAKRVASEETAKSAKPTRKRAPERPRSKSPSKKDRAAARRPGAPPPQSGGVGVLPWVLGAVGLLALILIISLATSGGSSAPSSTTGQPRATTGSSSRTDRMANQRYNELDGKTIKEWMNENGETDMARKRQQRRQDHEGGN